MSNQDSCTSDCRRVEDHRVWEEVTEEGCLAHASFLHSRTLSLVAQWHFLSCQGRILGTMYEAVGLPQLRGLGERGVCRGPWCKMLEVGDSVSGEVGPSSRGAESQDKAPACSWAPVGSSPQEEDAGRRTNLV